MEGGPQPPTSTSTEEEAQDHRGEAQETRLEPRIYVASLSDYNAGRLHGVWLDATQGPEELHDQITGMLAQSKEPGAEEWAVHDFEGFNGLHLGEWEDLDYVSRIANGIKEHGVAFAHWATMVSENEELDKFEDNYLGHWDSLTDYAEDIFEDLGLYEEVERCVSDNLRPYVTLDAAGFGRDLELSGDITVVEGQGGVHIFSNR